MIKLELMHQQSLGHPFYQYELARQDAKNSLVIFVSSCSYPYKGVEQFIASRFLLLRFPDFILKTLVRFGIVMQHYNIDPTKNYAQVLEREIVSSRKNRPHSSQYLAAVSLRTGPKNGTMLHRASARDYDENDLIDVINMFEDLQYSYLVVNPSIAPSNVKDESAQTIREISHSRIFIGTNSGPYVIAESLRKPCLLINVHPFLGTNGYHKRIDRTMPCPIYSQKDYRIVPLEDIIGCGLFSMNEDELKLAGFFVRKCDSRLLAESSKEFIDANKYNRINYANHAQEKIRMYIGQSVGISNPPYFTSAYISFYAEMFKSFL